MKYLVDSNIIIYHFNNENIATTFLLDNKGECAISQITYIEVLSFCFTPEQDDDVKKFLEGFKIIDVNREIAIQAVQNRKIKKIKLPDNIIASTAQVNSLVLVTRNVDDFKSLRVQLLNVFKD
jgi:predicted nucleic acid-binding protein